MKYALIITVLFAACVSTPKEHGEGIPAIPLRFEKYRSYVEDAKFKVYLKMGMQMVAVNDVIHRRDSMLLGEMSLEFAGCRELTDPEYKGLLVEFLFTYNNGSVFYNNSPLFVNGVFYRNKKIDDWCFAYGELSVISYEYPRQIDTAGVLRYLGKGGKLNAWFANAIKDSLLTKK